MVLDPAHQPFAVRARSWLLVRDTAVPTEEGKGPLGRWALVYGGKPQRRERDPALPAHPGFWEPGANGVQPGRSEVSVEEHHFSVSAREPLPSVDQSSQTSGFSLDLLGFSVSASPSSGLVMAATKEGQGHSQQTFISSLRQLCFKNISLVLKVSQEKRVLLSSCVTGQLSNKLTDAGRMSP